MNSLPVNTFKQALARQQRTIGLWVTFAHQPIAEVLADAGFDWLLFDMEHSPTDLHDVGQQLLAVRGRPVAPIVRIPIHDMAWTKRALDAGAPNIMVPNVRTAAEAREAVAWTRFAPEGLRGVAGSTRAGNYTRYKDYMARANDEIGVIVQIESQQALDELDLVVDLNFRMDTSALYSDVVLPAATWYEKDDLNSTDMHSFIHPLQAAVPPCWESRSDWDIFRSIAAT